MEQRLRELKSKFKECSSPSTKQDFNTLISYLKKTGVTSPGIPTELVMIWELSSEWHLIHEHYDVFGFNIFGPEKVVKLTADVFGDNDIRREWEEEFGPQSCGNIDWVCLASFSEFDYVFINLNKDSSLFGTIKHMVNNCNTEHTEIDPLSIYICNKVEQICASEDYFDWT